MNSWVGCINPSIVAYDKMATRVWLRFSLFDLILVTVGCTTNHCSYRRNENKY